MHQPEFSKLKTGMGRLKKLKDEQRIKKWYSSPVKSEYDFVAI